MRLEAVIAWHSSFPSGDTSRPWAKQRIRSTGLPPQEQLATLHLVQTTGVSVGGGGRLPLFGGL